MFSKSIGRSVIITGILVVVVGMSGCSSLGITDSQKARLIQRDGIDVVLDHSVGVGFVFKDQKTRERMCRTPGPDFATGKGAAVSLGLEAGPQAGVNDSFNAISMGGRSPGVLVLRELLFRACELVLNTDATPEQALAIYKYFISEGINASRALANSQGSQSVQLTSQTQTMGQVPSSSAYTGGGSAYSGYGPNSQGGAIPGVPSAYGNNSAGGVPGTSTMPAFNPGSTVPGSVSSATGN